MKKRICAVIFVVLISILTIPTFSAYAKESIFTDSNDFIINVIDGSYIEITGYIGSDRAVNVPDKINDMNVTKIGKNAFYRTDIESVVLPETIEVIGELAFADCKYLKSIKFTGSEPIIDSTAFFGCTSGTDSLTLLSVPKSWEKSDIPANSTTKWHGGYFNISFYSSDNPTGSSAMTDCLKPALIIAVSAVILFVGTVVVLVTVIRRERIQHSETEKINT